MIQWDEQTAVTCSHCGKKALLPIEYDHIMSGGIAVPAGWHYGHETTVGTIPPRPGRFSNSTYKFFKACSAECKAALDKATT